MTDQKLLGILFGVSAGFMWAVEAIIGKILLSSLTFVQVTASEAFFAASTAFGYIFVKRDRADFDRKNAANLLLVGLVGTVFAPLMYFLGLSQTYAVNATLIAHLQPLFVTILGFSLLKERLQRHDLVAGVLIVSAVILITGRTIENMAGLKLGNLGDLIVFFATLGWALVAIPGKKLTEEEASVTIVGYRFLIASIVFIPVLLCTNQLEVNSAYQVLLGVLVGLGYIFYYESLRRIKASQVALTELSSPFFSAVFAWIFLGEKTTPMQMAGALILVSGLYMLTRERSYVILSERETELDSHKPE